VVINRKSTPYPKGSLVELSDGSFAVVDGVDKNLPLHPLVRIIKKDGEKYTYKSIDLKKQLNLVVKQLVYEIK